MKMTKLALAVAAGSALAISAHADQTFHLYGSTAYRKATENAINLIFGTNLTSVTYDNSSSALVTLTGTQASLTSTLLGSTNLIWKGTNWGTNFPGEHVTVYCNWAGSVGGVQSLADPAFGLNADGNETKFLLDGGSYGQYSTSKVDVAMSDVDQSSTPYASLLGFNSLFQDEVSVLEFIWAKGNGGPANLSNAGFWTLQTLLNLGDVPVSQFTGINSDSTNMVYLTGRNENSGTRNAALGDCLYGPFNPVTQYNYTNAPGVYGYSYFGAAGDGSGDGFDSGGSVKAALIATRTANYVFTDATNPHGYQSYLMGYISITDALNVGGLSATAGSNTIATVTSAGVPTAQWLTYDGVAWSEPAIEEGAYTYFTYEHILSAASPTAQVAAFRTALDAEQKNQSGSSVVPGTMPKGLMNIAVRADAQPISHN